MCNWLNRWQLFEEGLRKNAFEEIFCSNGHMDKMIVWKPLKMDKVIDSL